MRSVKLESSMSELSVGRKKSVRLENVATSDFSRGETRILQEIGKLMGAQAETIHLVSGLVQHQEGISSTLESIQKAVGSSDEPVSQSPAKMPTGSEILARLSRVSEAHDAVSFKSPSQEGFPVTRGASGSLLDLAFESKRSSLRAAYPEQHLSDIAFESKRSTQRAAHLEQDPVVEVDASATQSRPGRKSGVDTATYGVTMFNHFSEQALSQEEALDEKEEEPAETPAVGMFTTRWPKDLAPLPIAQFDYKSEFHRRGSFETASAHTCDDGLGKVQAFQSSGSPLRQFLEKYVVIDPTKTTHMLYGCLSLVVLLHDLIVIPILLAWDVPTDGIFRVAAWTTACFWTLDVCVNFFTAVSKDGLLLRDLYIIARRYLQTWFSFDVFLLTSDWVTLLLLPILDSSQANSGSVKILRVVRLVRLLHILSMFRILTFIRVMEDFLDRTFAESYRLSIKIVSVLIVIAWVNHLICCGWFAVGRLAPSDTGLHWTDSVPYLDISAEDPVYQYWSSLHWSVAQITLGSMGVSCLNSYEHAFNVVCLMFGLLFGSSLISSLSATMVQFQMLRNGRAQKLQMLRKYLQDNDVDLHIATLVQKQVKERLGPKEQLTDVDIPELALLSSSLRLELRLEIYKPHVTVHPLFALWHRIDPSSFKRFCAEALDFRSLRAGDELFVAARAADPQAYLLIQGKIQYEQDPTTAPNLVSNDQKVSSGTVLAEAALYSQWIHVGKASAASNCRLLQVNGELTAEVLKIATTAGPIVRQYAQNFHRRLISAGPPRSAFPTDLVVPYTDFEDMVVAMEMNCQIAIGNNALCATGDRRWRGKQAALMELRKEVDQGKSVVMLNGSGDVQRVVSVIAVKVVDENEKVLVQLAKMEKGRLKFAGQLPGSKQQRGELATEAVQRVLETKLAPLTSCIEFAEMTRSSEEKESKQFGVRTKYLRTVCKAVLVQPFSAPTIIGHDPTEDERDMCTHNETLQSETGGPGVKKTQHPPFNITGRQVFVIKDDHNQAFYMWMTSDELDRVALAEEGCMKYLQRLLEIWDSGGGAAAARSRSFRQESDESKNTTNLEAISFVYVTDGFALADEAELNTP
mmetsp:Transcript_30522/g.71258  ORF Transcript_30522/g.71258 Transcript_30522/m.71258 type:complete len:1088 (-) Transcript_30522:115-3378(-)|eukprot:CAMPEP_0178394652 /NCGR_PEP_ID=MMETSP0689_2-20121128/12817_1 /TAXON_ID=160604 /ORGANISM="Amphidinium massartii, Strain CS-259" /LENGTH=1087 /DNA_ID=CAMNT_0020015289 /DNA_START=71 /DNA_END=3334 /DNA_ORIENTATION=+